MQKLDELTFNNVIDFISDRFIAEMQNGAPGKLTNYSLNITVR